MVNSSSSKFTLITGASRGIGKEIAIECARRGKNLLLVSRSEDSLKELALQLEEEYKIKVIIKATDLSQPQNVKFLYEWCLDNGYMIDMLINNAGCALFGEFERIPVEKQFNMIQLNIHSLVELTHLFLPMLKNQSHSYILNVASLAALYPLPYYSAYGASKAFVLSFSEALRFELRDDPVTVSCLCPGDTDTTFFKNAGNYKKKGKLMSPVFVAKAALDGLYKGETVIYPGSTKWISKIPKPFLKKIINQRVLQYL